MRKKRSLLIAVTGVLVLGFGLTAQTRPRPEVSLLGVRVFSPLSTVLKKFGNPTMVATTQIQLQEFSGQGRGGSRGGEFGEGGLPGPLGAPPGFGDGGGTPGPTGGPGVGDTQSRIETEMVYVYRVKGGSTYLFQVNRDGRVVQISAYGIKPDRKVRTSRGIGLGSRYQSVVLAYGYPDEHAVSGDLMVTRYNRLGVAFQFDTKTNKVTAVFVAAGIPNVGMGFVGLSSGAQGGPQSGGSLGMFGSGQPGGAPPPPTAPGMPGAPGGGGGRVGGAPAI